MASPRREPAGETIPTHDLPQNQSVYLRVTYLLTGNPRPPHNLGSVPVTTTINQLKTRIQGELPEHPQPDEQRLIYQGRPLLQGDLTLKEALRIETSAVDGLPYTIHIIIQPRNSTSHPASATSTHQANQQRPQSVPPRPQNATFPNFFAQPQPGADMQSLLQSRLDHGRNMMNPSAGQNTGHANTNNMRQNGTQQVPSGNSHTSAAAAIPQGIPVVHGNVPHLHNQHLFLQQMLQGRGPNQGPATAFGRQPVPNTFNTTSTSNGNNSEAFSAPGQPSDGTRRFTTTGPNGEVITTVIEGSVNMHLRGQPIPNSTGTPTLNPTNVNAGPQGPGIPNLLTNLAPLLQSLGGGIPLNLTNTIIPTPTTGPQVWLASSPTGPEALLFSPNHGFFTSARQLQRTTSAETRAPVSLTGGITDVSNGRPTASNQPQIQTQTNRENEGNAAPQGLNQQQGQARPAQPQQQQAQNAEENDIFGFIVQRGWLFLRLYMFMFVLSEPGTWRRWLLLIAAVIVCVLPRENPLNDALAAARRHLDNLIGPNQPQVQRQGQAPADHDATGQQGMQRPNAGAANTALQGATNLTPEPENRNQNSIINVLYRIEQAVALFLASLIPGVGERHVQAREDARRAAQQREEEERRRANEARETEGNSAQSLEEASRKSTAQTTTEDPAETSTRHAQGNSSGVEASSSTGEVRARSAEGS